MVVLESFVLNCVDVCGYIIVGFFLMVLFVVVVVFWVVLMFILGVVIVLVMVVVENNSKKVQYFNGGVVGEILVKDGDSVEVEQVVMCFDEMVMWVNLVLVMKQFDEIVICIVCFMVEIEGCDSIVVFDDIIWCRDEFYIVISFVIELVLFNSCVEGRCQQVGQLKECIEQLCQQVEGIVVQEQVCCIEVELVKKECDVFDILVNQSLINIVQVMLVWCMVVQFEGNLVEVMVQGVSVCSRIVEIQFQIFLIGQVIKFEVGKDLCDQQVKQVELLECCVFVQDFLKCVDI